MCGGFYEEGEGRARFKDLVRLGLAGGMGVASRVGVLVVRFQP